MRIYEVEENLRHGEDQSGRQSLDFTDKGGCALTSDVQRAMCEKYVLPEVDCSNVITTGLVNADIGRLGTRNCDAIVTFVACSGAVEDAPPPNATA